MDKTILPYRNFGSMKNNIDHLAPTEKRSQLIRKDDHIKGRKYNGHPHLKLKMVKPSPRQKIRQLLREAIALNQD